jgi:hypothetical protein
VLRARRAKLRGYRSVEGGRAADDDPGGAGSPPDDGCLRGRVGSCVHGTAPRPRAGGVRAVCIVRAFLRGITVVADWTGGRLGRLCALCTGVVYLLARHISLSINNTMT